MVISASAADSTTTPKENVFAAKPLGITLSIKMDGPYQEPADLQIICLFKHKQAGDTYQGAAKERTKSLAAFSPRCAIAESLPVKRAKHSCSPLPRVQSPRSGSW